MNWNQATRRRDVLKDLLSILSHCEQLNFSTEEKIFLRAFLHQYYLAALEEQGPSQNWPIIWIRQLKRVYARTFRNNILPKSEFGLFIIRQNSHMEEMLPIRQELKLRDRASLFLCLNDKLQVNKEARAPFYFSLKKFLRHWLLTNRIRKKLKRDYLGKKLLPLYNAAVRRQLIYFSQLIHTLEKLSSHAALQFVFVGNDISWAGRASCLWANANEIKSFTIQHGAYIDPIVAETVSDLHFLYGKRDEKYLVNLGVDKTHIQPVGSPKKDIWIDLIQEEALDAGARRTKKVLFAFSGAGHSVSLGHHRKLASLVCKAVALFPEIRFAIKLHRKDRAEFYTPCAFDNPHNLKIFEASDKPLLSLIHECDICVTGASTGALEAMLFSKPVITLDLQNELSDIPFIGLGATIHVENENDFLEILRNWSKSGHLPKTYDPTRAKVLIDEHFENRRSGQKASKRIVDILLTEATQ